MAHARFVVNQLLPTFVNAHSGKKLEIPPGLGGGNDNSHQLPGFADRSGCVHARQPLADFIDSSFQR